MKRNPYRYLAVVALICVLAAVAGCSSGTTVRGMIQAPVFVGVSLREAEAKAAEAGVQVEVQSSESSDTMPLDFVLRQDPEPQTVVQGGGDHCGDQLGTRFSDTSGLCWWKIRGGAGLHCRESAGSGRPRRASRRERLGLFLPRNLWAMPMSTRGPS